MTFEKKMPTMGAKLDTSTDSEGFNKEDNDNEVVSEENLDDQNLDVGQESDNFENDKTVNDKNAELIKELKFKNDELERKLLYIAAEYENSKKRFRMELENANKFAIGKFAIDAVNIYDVLSTALENVDKEKTDKVLFDGVKMTIGEFDKMFERIQINKIEPEVGSLFDHNKHEAIARVESDLDVGSIVKVIRSGYEIYGRLLRPASVIVSSGK